MPTVKRVPCVQMLVTETGDLVTYSSYQRSEEFDKFLSVHDPAAHRTRHHDSYPGVSQEAYTLASNAHFTVKVRKNSQHCFTLGLHTTSTVRLDELLRIYGSLDYRINPQEVRLQDVLKRYPDIYEVESNETDARFFNVPEYDDYYRKGSWPQKINNHAISVGLGDETTS